MKKKAGEKSVVESVFLRKGREGFLWNRLWGEGEQVSKTVQPADRRVQIGYLQVEFLEMLQAMMPDIIDDLFLRIFQVLSRHQRLLECLYNFSSKTDPVERYIRDTPTEVRIDAESGKFDKSGTWGLRREFYQAIKDWIREYQIEAGWCKEFALDVLRRYQQYRPNDPPLDGCILASFGLKFLNNSHHLAWRAILSERRERLARRLQVLDLFDNETLSKLRLSSDGSVGLPAQEPRPPFDFPSRTDGGRVLEKPEYQERVRFHLEHQFKLRLGTYGCSFDLIARWVVEYLEAVGQAAINEYNKQFDSFLEALGWVSLPQDRGGGETHLKWLILHRCGKLGFEDVGKHCQENYGEYHDVRAIKNAISKVENLLGFQSVRKRGGARSRKR